MKRILTFALVGCLAGTVQAANKPAPATTVPHVDMSLASIDSGKSYAAGLAQMSGSKATYDKDHAGIFKTQIQNSIQLAQTHLQHLQQAATGNQNAESAVKEAEQHLTNANTRLNAIQPQSGDPSKIATDAQGVWKELNKADERLGQAATQLGVPGKLKTSF